MAETGVVLVARVVVLWLALFVVRVAADELAGEWLLADAPQPASASARPASTVAAVRRPPGSAGERRDDDGPVEAGARANKSAHERTGQKACQRRESS